MIFAEKDVGGILTRRDGGNPQAGGGNGRQVLEAVDGQIDPAGQQGIFDLAGEESLVADFREGGIEDDIALGLDGEQLGVQIGTGLLEGLLDPAGLDQGQLAAAGADDNFLFDHARLAIKNCVFDPLPYGWGWDKTNLKVISILL
ncbi:MAG: hypothetical protein BWY71_00802 [Planctomycetes bacterium ADurb.Bin412]|nr:MAG: hypothetical protein BWY71_00802 [Planctomycetes bacterium ADurb.Bin412]